MEWSPPLIKALATALIVVGAAAFAEVLGPFWGALIITLPVSAGPAYVFLAVRNGVDFVAASALSSVAANAATGLFLITYGLLGRTMPPWRGLCLAVVVWLAGALATRQVAWFAWTAVLLNLVVYVPGIMLLKVAGMPNSRLTGSPRTLWFDLPVRAAGVAGFVSVVVAVSEMLGPAATGIMAVFPISLISLIMIVRPRMGAQAASLLAANALRSMLGFGFVLLALHLAIRPVGAATALMIALVVSVLWSAALLLLRTLRCRSLFLVRE